MAMQQRKRRRRSGGNNNNNNSTNPNKHFESNGPDVRIRGSAAQILEKYLQYARDAQTSGDRVKAEALYQHAEHYARIVAEITKEQEKQRLEREAREAAKAEERAARDAERQARNETRDDGDDESTDTPQETSDSDQGEPRRRSSRKPRETVANGSEAPVEAVTSDDSEADKPKRTRRKTYTPTDSAEAEDGVAKTLARGIEPAAAEGEA